jgi:hypothetical protein
MYIDTLRCLRNAVGRKRLEKWRTNSWFLFHYNDPAHWSFLVKDFLTNNNVTTLEHSQYSIYPTSADFYLYLDWNKNWSDFAVVMIVTLFRMRRKIWKGFQKMASKNVSKIFSVAGNNVHLHKRTILSERKHLEATIYKCMCVLFTEQSQNWNIILEGSEM